MVNGRWRIRAPKGNRRATRKAGITLIEVSIALAIVAVVLLASVGSFTTSLRGVNGAQRQSRGSLFLQRVMEDIAAQSYANLPAFNGNRFYDQTNATTSNFSVDLTVFMAAVDLQQVQAVLTDVRSQRVLARVTTMRTRT